MLVLDALALRTNKIARLTKNLLKISRDVELDVQLCYIGCNRRLCRKVIRNTLKNEDRLMDCCSWLRYHGARIMMMYGHRTPTGLCIVSETPCSW